MEAVKRSSDSKTAQMVMNFTGLDLDGARAALDAHDWVAESAVNALLDEND